MPSTEGAKRIPGSERSVSRYLRWPLATHRPTTEGKTRFHIRRIVSNCYSWVHMTLWWSFNEAAVFNLFLIPSCLWTRSPSPSSLSGATGPSSPRLSSPASTMWFVTKLWLDIRVFLCPSIWYVFCSNVSFFYLMTSGWCHPWWVSWPCHLYWRGSFGWGSYCQVLSSFLFFVSPCPLDYLSSYWYHNIRKLFLFGTFYVQVHINPKDHFPWCSCFSWLCHRLHLHRPQWGWYWWHPWHPGCNQIWMKYKIWQFKKSDKKLMILSNIHMEEIFCLIIS